MEFRLLKPNEIECRISTCSQYGVGILLYKDARCDQNILDETVGAMNWQRHHTRENANCIVSIWDKEKKQWIEKEDVGTESYTEKEKGLASDSFKRACFNWGIGRELYTAPNMFVSKKDLKTLQESNGRWTCKDYFKVMDLQYMGRSICYVRILNEKTNQEIEFGTPAELEKKQEMLKQETIDPIKQKVLLDTAAEKGVDVCDILLRYNANSIAELTIETWNRAMKALDKTEKRT